MTKEDVNQFEKIHAQMEGLYNEIGILSKKSPNDAINKFKLKFINQVLLSSNIFLIGNYKPLEGFEKFEEDDIPTNSDATMIFEQYLKCFEKLRADNITTRSGYMGWYWNLDDGVSAIRTSQPDKLKK